jgi:hypothetical protein
MQQMNLQRRAAKEMAKRRCRVHGDMRIRSEGDRNEHAPECHRARNAIDEAAHSGEYEQRVRIGLLYDRTILENAAERASLPGCDAAGSSSRTTATS